MFEQKWSKVYTQILRNADNVMQTMLRCPEKLCQYDCPEGRGDFAIHLIIP